MAKLKLTDREWKDFYIKDYFDFKRGNQNNMAKTTMGDIPLVSAKKVNNGIKDFITENNKELFEENIITLNNDGDGGVGIAYYQPFETALDTHVTALIPKKILSKYTLLFISRSITMQREKFSHGYSLNNNRLIVQKIILPADNQGEPDWQFMEDFIRQLEKNKTETILKYYNAMINNEKSARGGVAHLLKDYKWSAFKISDICEIFSGVRLTKQDMNEGKTPFIGASDSNNGVTAFINNHNASVDSDVLGVNYNGSVVENFYHPYQALFSDDVKRVKIKNYQGKYAYLFLKTAILKQKKKYQYGYKFNATRMAKQKILLPVNHLNQPDWEGMEIYMQRLELQKITQYIKSLHNPKSRILTNN